MTEEERNLITVVIVVGVMLLIVGLALWVYIWTKDDDDRDLNGGIDSDALSDSFDAYIGML